LIAERREMTFGRLSSESSFSFIRAWLFSPDKKRLFLLNVSFFLRIFWSNFYRFLEREAGCFHVFLVSRLILIV